MQGQIQTFLEHLAVDKRCSINTISAYRNDLGQFHAFLTSSTATLSVQTWQDLEQNLVKAYLRYLHAQGYASSTVARKMAAVRSFLSHLHSLGQVDEDLSCLIRPPKVEKTLPRAIAPETIERLLAEPAKDYTPKALRDKALLEVLYATGMRVSEVVNLDVGDVDTNTDTITCAAGSHRRRMVPIYTQAVDALKRYLANGRAALMQGQDERALFLNHRGRRLTRQGLWLIIREYVSAIGIVEAVTPHALRQSFASHLLNAGVNLQEVQQRMGHASTTTTQAYRNRAESTAGELVIDGVQIHVDALASAHIAPPVD